MRNEVGGDDWISKCKHANEIEDKYRMREPVTECVVNSFVIRIEGTDSNEADEDVSDSKTIVPTVIWIKISRHVRERKKKSDRTREETLTAS